MPHSRLVDDSDTLPTVMVGETFRPPVLSCSEFWPDAGLMCLTMATYDWVAYLLRLIEHRHALQRLLNASAVPIPHEEDNHIVSQTNALASQLCSFDQVVVMETLSISSYSMTNERVDTSPH